MLRTVKIVKHQGRQYIKDLQKATLPLLHNGLPEISSKLCPDTCTSCVEICPAEAISKNPLTVNLGQCVFCGECGRCTEGIIRFTNNFRVATNDSSYLAVSFETDHIIFDPESVRKEIRMVFGRSLKLRLVSDGSCNGCELELNATDNVNFDMSRYGIEFVASPRHADGIVVTGPLVENSAKALELTWAAIPDPKLLIAVGACAISGGVFKNSKALNRSFFEKNKPDLYIPGCPPHPLTIIDGLLKLTGRIKPI
ncbi:MAG TPA: NADH:ubiquinone oxidoreductase [Bacteroidales bacterium]|nr:NADH:ubiquinone oxidoreductase [Bacteroidales bacterium]HQI70242.1 NADH:ubiquinone oxidoreductase [Bacteroidales bacterium]